MTAHKQYQNHPEACTVRHLQLMMEDMGEDTVIMVAKDSGEAIDLVPIQSVTSIRNPIDDVEVTVIVPAGPEFRWLQQLEEMEAAAQEESNE